MGRRLPCRGPEWLVFQITFTNIFYATSAAQATFHITMFLFNYLVLDTLGKVSPKYQRDTYLNSDPGFYLFRSKSMQLFAENALETDGTKRSKLAFKEIRKATGTLSGAGDGGSTFGEATYGSLKRITDDLIEKCGLDHNALFLDIGHGLGKPSIFVAQYVGVRVAGGIENEKIRCQVSDQLRF